MNKRQNAYTLIELLLVIAVMSIISALAIATYRKHATNTRIETASLEIQNVLEAAMAYNVDTGSWPTANNTLSECTPNNPSADTFITDYLPNYTDDPSSNTNYQSNYGNNFCWSSANADNMGPLFWVALKIPLNDKKVALNTASRIAARLPNAIAVEDPTVSPTVPCTENSAACYVRTEVVQPAMASNQKGNKLAGMGYCDPSQSGDQPGSGDNITCTQKPRPTKNQYAIKFSCPIGKRGQVYLFPNFYKAAALPEANPPTILTVLSATTKNNESDPTENACQKEEDPTGLSNDYTCDVNITALYDHGMHSVVNPYKGTDGAIGATYMAYCVQPKTPPSPPATKTMSW